MVAGTRNEHYKLVLEKGQTTSETALRLVKQIDPEVQVVYQKEKNPEMPTPCLLEPHGSAFYGLEVIMAYVEERSKSKPSPANISTR